MPREVFKNPSVGKYNLDVNPIKESHPKISFGNSKRSSLNPFTSKNPPVGSYNIQGKLGDYGPKHTFGIKHDLNEKNNKSKDKKTINPGPADYDHKNFTTVNYRVSSWKFGNEARDYNPAKSTREVRPGPGTYTLGKPGVTNKSVFIGKSTRTDPKKMEVPGPGHYKIPYSLFDFPNFVQTNGFDLKFRYI